MDSQFGDTVLATSLQHLKEAIAAYQSELQKTYDRLPDRIRALIQTELETLETFVPKLTKRCFTIAALGLVSRGKSAVLNALLEREAFATGPINGVTQWPQTVTWEPSLDLPVSVDVIDTPGFDEVAGQERAAMARQIANRADLLLFVVAGDITRTEYQALQDLLPLGKPLLLIFNKVDLYPPPERAAVIQKLQSVLQNPEYTVKAENILQVAAEPMPIQTRVEWPDGRVSHEWERPAAQVETLQHRLLTLLQTQGALLLGLSVLNQIKRSKQVIAEQTVSFYQQQKPLSQERLTQLKALSIGLNPLGWIDGLMSLGLDLAAVRSRSRLCHLPMTSHGVDTIWQTILVNAGLLLGSEVLLQGFWGIGAASSDVWSGITQYGTGAVLQGIIALYGSNLLGKKIETYLQAGCTWGERGTDTLIQAIMQQAETS